MKTAVKKMEKEVVTKRYSLYWGDNCKVVPQLPDESVGLCIHSPPFSDLFSYSDSIEDMGNSRNYEEFFIHYGFLIKELERVMLPGRIVAVHAMDLPTHKTDGEEIGISDFPGDIIRCFIEHGFIFHSRFCVWKDPLIAAVRTKAIGLAHKQIIKDSVMCRTGIPDYILAFRKKGDNPKPVPHPTGLKEYAGARSIPKELYRYANVEDQRKNKFSHWIWQQYACMMRDSMVLTEERGYIPIQDVLCGEHVLTHRGRWMPVIGVTNSGTRQVIKVKGQGISGMTLTPDHKIWTRKSDWVRERDGAKFVEPAWIEAQNTLGGYINSKLPPIKEPDIVDELHWWIVGRWLADGHFDAGGRPHISCNSDEVESLRRRLGNHAGFTREMTVPTAYQVYVKDPDQILRGTLNRCGRGAVGKHLPPEAFTLPVAQAKSLLDGYLSGDGCFQKEWTQWKATSISRVLLLGMAVLAQRVYGSIASVYAGRSPRMGNIRGKSIRCKQEWTFGFPVLDTNRRSTPFILDDGAWKRVRSIEDAGEQDTWDIQVAEDQSFTVEGCIVHNSPVWFDIRQTRVLPFRKARDNDDEKHICPFATDTVERCLELWSAKGDVVLDPFMGVGTVPYIAAKRGRKGLGVELKGSYFRMAVRNLESLELSHSAKGFEERNGK